MTHTHAGLSTGLPDLDAVLCGLMPGDNLVWQVEAASDYKAFVTPFVECALRSGRTIVYFRFARHEPLIPSDSPAVVLDLDPQSGFESFLDDIHSAIRVYGSSANYVFDTISDLTADWYSDQMVGNFFMLVCPFLRNYTMVAYFGLLRNYHSFYATDPVNETTQILLDVHCHGGKHYVHPLKVAGRRSPQMHQLYVVDGATIASVQESHTIAEVLRSSRRPSVGVVSRHLGVWSRTFVMADALLEQSRASEASPAKIREMCQRLLRMAISREERMLRLAEEYLALSDLVEVGTRMLGTGLIGGKSVEMLIARAILRQSDPRWNELLETHDSFFIPSDIFYTYLVRNGCWAIRKRQLRAADYLEGAEEAHQAILQGSFPEHIRRRFGEMLDYFGQSPVVVRSSSLLEDSFGNSFAGKYESVYCANQGSREERLEDLIAAVKTVYASTMSQAALRYRARHGLLESDEQMALLVQRVSGSRHGRFFFPHVSGVGFSFNPYVWSEHIDPHAGVLRLVFGLGTRAVDRADDDYTRLVALNAPEHRPEDGSDDMARHAQHRVDVLDLSQNRLVTLDFQELAQCASDIPLDWFVSRDRKSDRLAQDRGLKKHAPSVLTFNAMLTRTRFVEDMRAMLQTLETAYKYPVDIEFTANFRPDGTYRISLVQCRPLQAKGVDQPVAAPVALKPEDVLFEGHGPVIGRSRWDFVERIVYVVPGVYGQLPVNDRYAVARLVGQLNRLERPQNNGSQSILLGPGRWGSTTPSLGVPVGFGEINAFSVLCELVTMRDDLVPDVSFGTHFFNELVELDMLYIALYVRQERDFLNRAFLESAPNKLEAVLPGSGAMSSIVRVIDLRDSAGGRTARLWADTVAQRVVCYLE